MKKLFIIYAIFIVFMMQGCSVREDSDANDTIPSAQTGTLQNNAEMDDNKSVYAVNDALEFSFPNDWKQDDEENPFDLQCFSNREDLSTSVIAHDKMNLAENSSAEDIFNLQIDELRSIRENFKFIEETKDTDMGGKRIKTVVYSGEKNFSKNYYICSLVEFENSEQYAIVIQVCIPSNFKKYKTLLEEIINSCEPIQ